MTRSLFGTDGVRGRANDWPMTAEVALRLAAATGRHFRTDTGVHRVVIGKDTRLSGYMLETALTAGFTATGMNVFLLGPLPTPGVGWLTRSMRADLGVMISASHNPAEDNGIKFFGPDGFKLSDADEAAIERIFHDGVTLAQPRHIGRATRIDDALGRYVEYAKTTFPKGLRLDGLKVVLDCANGAAWRAAPEALWELGAEVIPVGVAPNGMNINADCGSTHPQAAIAKLRETGAHVALCLDGDADRLIVIDETGKVADGDQIMALIATRWTMSGMLKGGALVATVMSNLGLERHMNDMGVGLERTQVGDRYVVERMRAGGFNLGGEQSGHIVMTDHATTGDGLVGALQVLAAMAETGLPASRLTQVFTPVPQRLENIRYAPGADPLATDRVQATIATATQALKGTGRVLVRKSGTEPLIRIMVEAESHQMLDQTIAVIADAIHAAGTA